MRFAAAFTTAFVLGAGTVFFLDPQLGKRRRHVARDRTLRLARRAKRAAARKARYTAGQVRGLAAETVGITTLSDRSMDDETVRDRILSEAFRNAPLSASGVNVTVSEGVATLRGSFGSQTLADDLVERIRAIPGVRAVTPLITVAEQPTAS